MKKILKRLTISFFAMLMFISSVGCTITSKYEIQDQEYYDDIYEETLETLKEDSYSSSETILDFLDLLDIFREEYYDGEYDSDKEYLSMAQDEIYAQMNSLIDGLDEMATELSNNEKKERTLREVGTIVGEDLTKIMDEILTKQVEFSKTCAKEITAMKRMYDGKPLDEKYYSNIKDEIQSYEIYLEETMQHAANMAIGSFFGGMLNGGFNDIIKDAFSTFY